MSVRPREAAEEASKFSLRSVFAAEPPRPAVVQQQQQPQHPLQPKVQQAVAPVAPPTPTAQPQGLTFAICNLPTAQPPPSMGNGLKFTLPAMRSAADAAPVVHRQLAGQQPKTLPAGFITGGSARGDDPEIMRLKAIVDDLQEKLKRSTDKLAKTEQSVARGNQALLSERNLSHAKIVALAAEVKNGQVREAALRAEIAAAPKAPDIETSNFKMKAEGAVQLSSKYEEAVGKNAELEAVVADLRNEHEALTIKHIELQTALEAAKTGLEMAKEAHAKELATANQAHEQEMAQMTPLPTSCCADDMPMQMPMHRDEEEEMDEEMELPLGAPAMALTPEPVVVVPSHEDLKEQIMLLTSDLEKMRASTDATLQRLEEAHSAEKAEADILVKQLDLKLADERERVRQLQEEPPSQYLDAFENYRHKKQEASVAAQALIDAGAGGTAAMRCDAARKASYARRAWDALCYGNDEAPRVGCCAYDGSETVAEEEEQPAHVLESRARLDTGVAIAPLRLGLACCATEETGGLVSHDVALERTSLETEPTARLMARTSQSVGLKIRTDAFVAAVSSDVKRRLEAATSTWNTSGGLVLA